MNQKLLDALKQLDVTNDNHWTVDGLPRLETVRILTAEPSLSREELTKAVPGFSRASALAGASMDEQKEAAQMKPPAPLEEDMPKVEQVERARPVLTLLEEEMQKLAELDGVVNEVAQARAAQQAVVDKIIKENVKALSDDFATSNAAYLASQKKQLEIRAGRIKMVRESGVNLAELNKMVSKAPIDNAMARKTQRGVLRPTRG